MPYQLELEVNDVYIKGVASGRQTLKNNETMVREMVDACVEYKLDKFVIDLTGTEGQPGTFSDFQLAEYAVEHALRVVKKLAIIASPDEIEFSKFFETAANNRGLNVKAFVDAAEAEAWIIQE